jgi:hypothetical protein
MTVDAEFDTQLASRSSDSREARKSRVSRLVSTPSTLRMIRMWREALPVPVSTRTPSRRQLAVPSSREWAGPRLDREDVIMRAALFNGPKDITVGDRPDPVIQEPTDAVVRVVLACVCGSDAAMDERRAIKSLIRIGAP